MKKEKIALVAGAAGFIGSHLSEKLMRDENYKVIGVDNFSTGSPSNISYLNNYGNFTFVEHDIKKPLEIEGHIDAIFDFACPASPTDFEKLRMNILEANSIGLYHLLSLSVSKDATFIFSSSSEVYGDAEVNPQPEEYTGNVDTTEIRSIYDEGKRFGESMVTTFHREYGLPIRIVRIFNTYGERMRHDDGRAIPTFITQALLQKDITLFGDGKQTRSPQYISDLVDGIIRLYSSDIISPVNIGNPDEMSVEELAKRIISVCESTSKIVYKPLPHLNDPKVRKPDITKAKQLLNWTPTVSFDEGIKKTVDWFLTKLER